MYFIIRLNFRKTENQILTSNHDYVVQGCPNWGPWAKCGPQLANLSGSIAIVTLYKRR